MLKSNEARYLLEVAGIGSDLIIRQFTGQEAISSIYKFEIALVSQDAEIDCGNAVNKPAAITMINPDGSETKVHGVVSHMQQRGRIRKDWVEYTITIVPRLWRASLSYQSRVLQEMNAQEIIGSVLEENGLALGVDFEFRITEPLSVREYTTQFRETDLQFISRLLEFEGVHYFFDQSGDREKLVMTDVSATNGTITGPTSVSYHPDAGLVSGDDMAEQVLDFISVHKVVTGKVVLNDYNYREPESNLLVQSQLNSEMPGTQYEYGEHYKTRGEGERLVRIRNEEIESQRETMSGSSTCMRFSAGRHWALADHFRDTVNADYMITELYHEGAQGFGFISEENAPEFSYRNRFTVIRSNLRFRPRRLTPEPTLPGLMTARVDSAGGDYADIDDEGRYKVKMPFDLSDRAAGTATKPIRLAQPYSGSEYGMHFPIHKGADMVWACVNGNLDRPLALGTAPHVNTKSPSKAGNRQQNVIRTWGNNEFTMDDTVGQENVLLNATRDHNATIANDQNYTVGSNASENVGLNRTRSVGADEMVTIGSNQNLKVAAEQQVTVGANQTVTVSANQTQSVAANQTRSVGGNASENVSGMKNGMVGALESQVAGLAMNKVGQIFSSVMGTAALNLSTQGKMTQKARTIEAKGTNQITIEGTDLVGIDSGDWIAVKAPLVTVDGENSIILTSGSASIELKNGVITIKGDSLTYDISGEINTKAGGQITDKSPIIMEN